MKLFNHFVIFIVDPKWLKIKEFGIYNLRELQRREKNKRRSSD